MPLSGPKHGEGGVGHFRFPFARGTRIRIRIGQQTAGSGGVIATGRGRTGGGEESANHRGMVAKGSFLNHCSAWFKEGEGREPGFPLLYEKPRSRVYVYCVCVWCVLAPAPHFQPVVGFFNEWGAMGEPEAAGPRGWLREGMSQSPVTLSPGIEPPSEVFGESKGCV